MNLVDWYNVRDPKSLTEMLREALLTIFKEEFLNSEVRKFKEYSPKGGLETLAFLHPYPIHRAAKWFMLLEGLKKRGHFFDLRFSAEIEEFMNLLLFVYSVDVLVKQGVLSLNDKQVMGALRDNDRFESLTYEILIATNYVTNGFDVELTDLSGKGRVDIYARKGAVSVYCECKRLRRREEYAELAVEVMRGLHERRLNLIVDVDLGEVPRTGKGRVNVNELAKIIEDAMDRKLEFYRDEVLTVKFQKLPEIVQEPYELIAPQPESIEYLISSAYAGIFDGVLKVKEPKLVIIRDSKKFERISRQLNSEVRRAYEQLSQVGGGRKVIYVDVSEVAGKPMLQLPEMVKMVGPEVLASRLEALCRNWLINHGDIDSIVLTQPRLYVDEFGNPYLLNVENRAATAFTSPGWAIEISVIPIPQDATPELLVNLGVEVAKKGNYRLAYFYYLRAIELNPNLKEAYNNLGKLLTDMGRPDEALKHLNKALELDPNYTSALINKGIALVKIGMLREALKHLDKAIGLEPGNVKAWYNKALTHYILGELDKAYEGVLKALNINPNYELAVKLKEEVEKALKK